MPGKAGQDGRQLQASSRTSARSSRRFARSACAALLRSRNSMSAMVLRSAGTGTHQMAMASLTAHWGVSVPVTGQDRRFT